MPHIVSVESSPCDILFCTPSGTVVFDALDLNILLHQAYKVCDPNDDTDPTWIGEFKRLIEEKYAPTKVTGRDALALVDAVHEALEDLKKTTDATLP